MIKWIRIENLKALQDFCCDLAPFRVFVGTNGSGKTSVLQALECLSRSGIEQLAGIAGNSDIRMLRTRGTDGPIVMEQAGAWGGQDGVVTYTMNAAGDAGSPSTLRILYGNDDQTTDLSVARNPRTWPNPQLGISLPSVSLLRLDSSMVSQSSNVQPDTRLFPRGDGTTGRLAGMRLTDPERLSKIEAALRNVISDVAAIEFSPVSQNFQVDFVMKKRGERFPAFLASEGTVMALALMTAIHESDSPQLILIDDIDRALHPQAQRGLVNEIRKVLQRRPNLQIVATTHSRAMLDCLTTDEIRLIHNGEDGSQAWSPKASNENYKDWEAAIEPNENWRRMVPRESKSL